MGHSPSPSLSFPSKPGKCFLQALGWAVFSETCHQAFRPLPEPRHSQVLQLRHWTVSLAPLPSSQHLPRWTLQNHLSSSR